MTNRGYAPSVRAAAERIAAAWLRDHAYCDCAIQQQAIALRLLPVVAMFEAELERGARADHEALHLRLSIYLVRAHDELCKGLHRPGESALRLGPGRSN